MSLGPLMVDLEGYTLNSEERELLQHPLIGGVILFGRNYQSPTQLIALTTEIRALRQPALLIAVDQEGGRVQRFQEQFVRLPACAKLGKIYDRDNQQALTQSEQMGWLLAAELRAVGVDFSFAPVLDLEQGISTVIGDRAFHSSPEVVAELANAMMIGMLQAGMTAVGKHFPGHGSVAADSHHTLPICDRRVSNFLFQDFIPFERMIHSTMLAVMTAHVIYPLINDQPASFSEHWIQGILRLMLKFQGAVFSDDISMAAAAVIGDPLARTQQALQAGCDMVLICNERDSVIQVVDNLGNYDSPNDLLVSQARLARLYGQESPLDWESLHKNEKWSQCSAILTEK